MYIFICEDSIDGIFTGIYDAWASGYGHENVALTAYEPENYMLFCEYIRVQTDFGKSGKVARTLRRHLGEETYGELCQAALAFENSRSRRHSMDKADAIYKTVVLALSRKDGSKILQCLGEPCVSRTFRLSRSMGNEAHHLLGFLRFRELENGVLFAQITPKNHVLEFLGEHFSDRLPEEDFMIYDAAHGQAALHTKGKGFFITDTQDLDEAGLSRISGEEAEWQRLWKGFFDSIAIEARKNPKLQGQNLPKRFWKNMVELEPSLRA
ncbi:MAG: DNA metabolism protein [Lachnospiraceae bacterium]|nr:DNA metabolism protein [Lachnospiraceae bacterium]